MTGTAPGVRVITARALGLLLAAAALWDGVGLLVGGDSSVQTPSWAVLRAFPGTLLMGLIYTGTALALLYSLARPGELLAWVLSGGAFLYASVAVSFFASWLVTHGQIVWTAPSKPLAFAVLWLLVLLARPVPTLNATEAHRTPRR